MTDSKLRLWTYGLAAVLAAALPPSLAAAEAETTSYDVSTPAPASSEDMVILTYEVSDLILDVPDHPPGSLSGTSPFGSTGGRAVPGIGGMMSMGGGMMGGGLDASGMNAGPSARSTRITMEDLDRVLLQVIAPESWRENNGEGQLQHLGTSLVIRQTQPIHDEIQNLLDQLRNGQGKQRTVAIDARWLLLDSDELDQLIPPDQATERQVDRAKLDEFTRRPTSIRGRTNCFTGQLVYLTSGTRRNVVTSFVPVVGSVDSPLERQYASLPGGAGLFATQLGGQGRAVGYQPVVATPNLGVLLQIRPTLVPGEDRAIVDLHSTLTSLGNSPAPATPAEQSPFEPMAPSVDRLAIDTQELGTTLSVPLGKPVLAGGLTYIASSSAHVAQDAGKATSAETPQLYLVLELQ